MHLACSLRHAETIELLLSAWEGAPLVELTAALQIDGLPGSSGRVAYVVSPLLSLLAGPGSELVWPPPKAGRWIGSGVVASRTPKGCVLSAPDPHLGDLGAPSPVKALPSCAQILIAAETSRAMREGHWPNAVGLVDLKATASLGLSEAAGGGGPITWLTLLSRSRQPRAHETCEILSQHSRLDATPVRLRLRAEAAEVALVGALQGGEASTIQEWVAAASALALDWGSLQAQTLSALDSLATDADDGAVLAALLTDPSAALPLTTLKLTGGATLLHRAAAANRAPKVRSLLAAGADCHEQRTPKGDTALHVAVAASALEAVDVLLAHPSGVRCVHAKSADGKTPTDCVDKSKKSASAAAAKKIRQLLTSAAEKVARAHAAASAPEAARERPSTPQSAGTSQPPSPPKPKPQVASPSEKEAAPPAPKPSPPPAPVNSSEALHKRLASESTALTRRALEEELSKPLAREGGGAAGTLQLRPKDAIAAAPSVARAGGAAAAAASSAAAASAAAVSDAAASGGGAAAAGAAASGAAAPASGEVGGSDATPSDAPSAEVPSACARALPDGEGGAPATTPATAAASKAAAVPPAASNAVVPSGASRASCNEHADLFEDHPWRVLIVRPAARDLSSLEVQDKQVCRGHGDRTRGDDEHYSLR